MAELGGRLKLEGQTGLKIGNVYVAGQICIEQKLKV